MKKNLIYLLILVALAAIAYFAFNREKRLFPIEDANFQIKNTEDITKVFLSDPAVGNIKLTKLENGKWMVNDSFKARQDWVNFLMEAFRHQNASQMVPKSMHNSTIKQLAGSSVKVEVFMGEKKTNQFFVAKETSKDNMTVMLNIRPDGSNAPRPFMVKYGVGNTFLGVRYKTDLETWRDKQILNFEEGEIVEFKMSYPDKPENDFVITTEPNLQINKGGETEPVNIKRLRQYLSFYDKLFCMGFENGYYSKDSILEFQQPAARILVSNGKEERSLNIYYRKINKGTHYIKKVDGTEYDGDSYFGWLDNKDFVLLGQGNVEKILRIRKEFFEQDAPIQTQAD